MLLYAGLGSKEVYWKYPGITFLPDYKMKGFTEPNSNTGVQISLDEMSEAEAEERFYR